MKKTFKAFSLALISVMWLMFMAAACRKAPPEPEPDLPPETQTGAGTIGCYINDKPWWPKPYFVIGGTQFLEVSFNPLDDNRFYIQSVNKNDSTGSYMSLTCKKLKLGDNQIDTANQKQGGWSVFEDYSFKNSCTTFTVDTTKVRTLLITRLDSINRIVSGTFEFTAYNKCGNILRFRQGRFDTNF